MRIRKIEKEILENVFPNVKMKFLQATPDNRLRGFTNAEDSLALLICDSSIPRPLIEVLAQLMLCHKHFDVVISHYKDKILVIMTKVKESITPNT